MKISPDPDVEGQAFPGQRVLEERAELAGHFRDVPGRGRGRRRKDFKAAERQTVVIVRIFRLVIAPIGVERIGPVPVVVRLGLIVGKSDFQVVIRSEDIFLEMRQGGGNAERLAFFRSLAGRGAPPHILGRVINGRRPGRSPGSQGEAVVDVMGLELGRRVLAYGKADIVGRDEDVLRAPLGNAVGGGPGRNRSRIVGFDEVVEENESGIGDVVRRPDVNLGVSAPFLAGQVEGRAVGESKSGHSFFRRVRIGDRRGQPPAGQKHPSPVVHERSAEMEGQIPVAFVPVGRGRPVRAGGGFVEILGQGRSRGIIGQPAVKVIAAVFADDLEVSPIRRRNGSRKPRRRVFDFLDGVVDRVDQRKPRNRIVQHRAFPQDDLAPGRGALNGGQAAVPGDIGHRPREQGPRKEMIAGQGKPGQRVRAQGRGALDVSCIHGPVAGGGGDFLVHGGFLQAGMDLHRPSGLDPKPPLDLHLEAGHLDPDFVHARGEKRKEELAGGRGDAAVQAHQRRAHEGHGSPRKRIAVQIGDPAEHRPGFLHGGPGRRGGRPKGKKEHPCRKDSFFHQFSPFLILQEPNFKEHPL